MKRLAVTAEQMRAIDELATDKYGLQLIQMMENAGRNLAELARTMVEGQAEMPRPSHAD